MIGFLGGLANRCKGPLDFRLGQKTVTCLDLILHSYHNVYRTFPKVFPVLHLFALSSPHGVVIA